MVDLRLGPMVVETLPQALGMFDDRWWQWIVDFGLPGPDRGEGGPVPARPAGLRRPGARQRVPHRALAHDESFLLGRAFMVNDDPAPTVELIKRTTKIYPYAQGGFGTSIATLLEGQVDSWCRHLDNHRLRVMARPSRESSIAAWLSRCWPCSVSI
jgi:hypothetical protein